LRTARAAHAHLRARHPVWTGQGEVYSGFAHGVAAMHASLRQLASTGGDAAASADADDLLRSERELRDPASGRWFVSSRRDRTASGWCNGSAGILLGRLLALRAGHPADADSQEEVDHLLDDVERNGFGNDITACHGDLGSLDVLRLAAQVLDDSVLGARVEATAAQLVDQQLATFRSAPRSRFALVDSIFLGAAGAGHALLRSHAPEVVPAFLWLD
ncbi:lanthionine synthetase LanC family protein, partial [uncultured Cellulomonas sp.]|uniref:lanthionine synthetase LanC family protein n=1 Tax=uncultured Cellulomonas sp. TaxID=189682 RepID=UPI0028E6BF16